MHTPRNSNSNRLGHWHLDAEHDQLFALIDIVQATIAAGKEEAEVRSQLERFYAWAEKHFAHEEDNFRNSGYRDREIHVAHHQELLLQLQEFIAAPPSDKNAKIRAGDVVYFLKNWMRHHIDTDDRGFAEHLKSKNAR